jgi:hypothetical protein
LFLLENTLNINQRANQVLEINKEEKT